MVHFFMFSQNILRSMGPYLFQIVQSWIPYFGRSLFNGRIKGSEFVKFTRCILRLYIINKLYQTKKYVTVPSSKTQMAIAVIFHDSMQIGLENG